MCYLAVLQVAAVQSVCSMSLKSLLRLVGEVGGDAYGILNEVELGVGKLHAMGQRQGDAGEQLGVDGGDDDGLEDEVEEAVEEGEVGGADAGVGEGVLGGEAVDLGEDGLAGAQLVDVDVDVAAGVVADGEDVLPLAAGEDGELVRGGDGEREAVGVGGDGGLGGEDDVRLHVCVGVELV
eukprot:TRINITY_DN10942_c0_g3_i1.p2 TRINITY_DN10942_c0_g3~~TRINITY_DN10942_c0_g3_i1.p2  ORF type:complete len:180 (-),score=30.02 TRINITY_DN10942_c0_g3_i1:983-1522(-)